jgi:serine protease SohB
VVQFDLSSKIGKGEFMIEVGIFAAKALIILLALGSLIVLIAMMAMKANNKSELEVEPLHSKYKDTGFFLKSFTATKEDLKAEKKKLKAEKKEAASHKVEQRVFVIDFNGDVKASQVENLREEITAVLSVATPQDEVVVKLESPGGVVHGYGLAASQLLRVRERGIKLTVCVDKVAASGGYLMSCVANQIITAPFAIIGSIGVVAQVPNFHRILKKNEVDFKEYTAGEYKRTVSILGEITPKGEAKFIDQLESTHGLFKKFVSENRPQLDVAKVATGEYWYGEEAKALGLVDKIQTSDDYLLLQFPKDTPIFEISYQTKSSLADKLADFMGQAAEKSVTKLLTSMQGRLF